MSVLQSFLIIRVEDNYKGRRVKFKKEKLSALSEQTQVVFTEETTFEAGPADEVFRIVASKSGIQFSGVSPEITDSRELDAFAKAVAMAWKEHRSLVPKLFTNASGH
jgi:hypothetical protein